MAFRRFASVPEDSTAFGRIFGHEPTAAQASDISRILSEGRSSGLTIVRSDTGAGTLAQQFLDRYHGAPSGSQVFTLVGHNAGGQFRFADGSPMDLTQLGDQSDKLIAVISCESGAFVNGNAIGIPTRLTYTVAYRAETNFVARVRLLAKLGVLPSHDEAQRALESALNDAASGVGVQVRWTAVAVGSGGVAAIAIWQG